MKPIHEMSPEEKLFACAYLQLLADAIDGPMFDEPSEFYIENFIAKRDALWMIETRHPTFIDLCLIIEEEPERIRQKILSGELTKTDVMRYYTMINRD